MRKWMMTFTGRTVDPLNPKLSDIDIVDIAHHLAIENRYGGATRVPYPVAQHSTLVGRMLHPDHALEGHLHDASEYITKDLPKPIKDAIKTDEYEELERIWREVIFQRFEVESTPESRAAVKIIDQRIVLDETRALMARPDLYPIEYPDLEPLLIMIHPWPWTLAKGVFLDEFEYYMEARG
jgi:hypothetical protein